jgi:hypothetical protein
MSDAPLSPASLEDLADAVTFALRFDGRERKHDAGEFMGRIVARSLVEHLERAGFVVIRKPLTVGVGALDRGYERPSRAPAAAARSREQIAGVRRSIQRPVQ